MADPTILVLAVYDSKGLIGHGVANLLVDQHEVFVNQCDVDPASPPGVVDTLIEQCNNWGNEHKATIMRFESPTDLHTARAWAKRYGFKLVSYEMERPIHVQQKENQGHAADHP